MYSFSGSGCAGQNYSYWSCFTLTYSVSALKRFRDEIPSGVDVSFQSRIINPSSTQQLLFLVSFSSLRRAMSFFLT